MRMLRVVSALAVLSFIFVPSNPGVRAAGPVSEVLIGELLPLTGNFASLGQQYLWAGQTVEDIVNNDYPGLKVPLGPGKGFPGLGGAKMTLVVRDDQSRGDQARTLAEQLITVNKVHWLNGEG
ncbi:MAG: ABC transporter substrate-binding protein, partial [Candidatus Rokuibacteriota bacterium]